MLRLRRESDGALPGPHQIPEGRLDAIAAALGHARRIDDDALLALAREVLPIPLSPFLAGQLGFVIALFGGVYLWLARQPIVNRPLLVVGGLGKLGFFALAVAYSISGDVPAQVAINALPDLALGALFLRSARAARQGGRTPSLTECV